MRRSHERTCVVQPGRPRHKRRGAALLVALGVAAVAALLIVLVVRIALTRHQVLRAEAARLQAAWLAESGMDRAAARLAADGKYAGETWDLPAESLGGRDAARVKIEIATPGNGRSRRVRVVADYPDDPHRRVRITIEREIGAAMVVSENSVKP